MTHQETQTINFFLLKLITLSTTKKIKLIYRGENLHTLYKKLGLQPDLSNSEQHAQLLDRLFLIGDKAKNYFSKELFGFPHNYSFSIEACGDDVFAYIFDSINNCVKSKNQTASLARFFETNSTFKEYFLNKKGNKLRFQEAISNLPLKRRLAYRNYYLRLLHQIGSIDFRNRSQLISTTEDYHVAQSFSIGDRSQKGAIIHAWEPFILAREYFDSNMLPIYKGRPYSWQKEISLLGGLFPHYIICLEIPSERKIFYNPSIITTELTEKTFLDGLNVDQSRFSEIIRDTGYSKFVVRIGNRDQDIDIFT